MVLEKNTRDFVRQQKKGKGIFDYETGKYTNEEESASKNKKIEEIIKKRKTNTLKFEEELDNSSFSYDKKTNTEWKNTWKKTTKQQEL